MVEKEARMTGSRIRTALVGLMVTGTVILGDPLAAHAKEAGDQQVFHGSKCVRLFQEIAAGTSKYSVFSTGPGPDECTVTVAG